MTHKGRILLVEDDKFLRRACEAGLRQRGFEVVTATEGDEGLRLARTPPLPDVVLLDLLMPKLPGVEVLRALKADAATASIPVLILSNSSRDEDRQRAVQLGAAGYYIKANLSLKELAAEVEKLVKTMPPPVDLARLEAFSDGTAEGLRFITGIFIGDTLATLHELCAAVERADADAICLLAHRAGGSSAACGASTLAALLFQLETAASPRTCGADSRLATQITGEFEAVKSFLETYVEGLPS